MQRKAKSQKSRIRNTIWLLVCITAFLFFILILIPTSQKKNAAKPGVEESIPAVRENRTLPEAGVERPVPEVRLALVIDDVGYNLENLDAFLKFPGKITFAVLPGLPLSSESAYRIIRAQKDFILHCPMEPLNGQDPGPGALYSESDTDEINSILDSNFSLFETAPGMNNHMGSKITSDDRVMRDVMSYLKKKNKFFLDSKTSKDSCAADIARKAGVSVLERDVFIDNQQNSEYIRKSILNGIKIAQRKGFAVLIGHINSIEILNVLNELSPEFIKQGIKFSSLSELIAIKEEL